MKRLEKPQIEWLAQRFQNRVRFDEPLAPYTSFQIGGPAEALIIPESPAELTALIKGAREREIAYRIIGGGTNLLVNDRGVSGLVVVTTRCLEHILLVEEAVGHIHISVGASVLMKRLCRYCLAQGFQGMNFAIGIPGTIGGALIMNAGTGKGTVANVLSAMMLLTTTGEICTLNRNQFRAENRRLSWEPVESDEAYPPVILGCELTLTRADAAMLRAEARHIMRQRGKTQPLGIPSAGCIFKNPVDGLPAGQLIDMAGLKGAREGGAVISARHANYILNAGGATAAEVMALMARVKETVWNRFQIQLEPEVKLVGE
ncbi:MAG: UDP-N-acetylmuramate dehydrogenase [Desulfobacterales bacterium]|jgi:UDP-N-acetylmuramate dehydrogenase|nr:UDP-N-acetylmuramate dehydrogenase [Desulfobacterales bacterium]